MAGNNNSLDIVSPFGIYNGLIANYPNDVVELDVYNAVNQYLESNFRIQTYKIEGSQVTLDLERDLSELGYISGKYNAVYRFHRNYLGSGDGHKLQIQEVSADGLEIRVIPTTLSTIDNSGFLDFFSNGFFNIPKPQVLPNLFVFKDATTSVPVFDYVQDKFTYTVYPYSIILKLSTPLPVGVNVTDFIWVAQQVNPPVRDVITIVPPKPAGKTVSIAGPNWDILTKDSTSVSTQYKDWDDLLTANVQTSNDIVNKLLSSSYLEGMPLNVDYRKFENFVTFGSAAERLYNFKYKMELLESYDTRIKELTVDLTGLPSGSATGSLYFQNNVLDAKTKKAALIGSFDGYEKYLYYQSSSYVTNSFGEFYPTTWPKSTTTLPYANYSYTSSQVETWFDGIIYSASIYDQNNFQALHRIIPSHVVEDSANEEFTLFTSMIGHYFDLVFAYIKGMTDINNRDESLVEGFSKDLVFHLSKNLGIDFENGSSLEELWSYTLGTDSTGSLVSTYGISSEDKTKEIWKRILNNLPYLLRTKGTERSVRALINCFGIPQTILRIREFGGAEPDFDTKSDLVYERFNYAYNVGQATSSFYYYNTASWNSGTNVSASGLFSIPWKPLENNLVPMSTQLRVKMAFNQSADQVLMEVPNKWYIKTFSQGTSKYVGFFLNGNSGWTSASVSSSIYDNTFHSVTLLREQDSDVSVDDQTYKLIVKKTNYEKVVSTQTASLFIPGASSSSYNASFTSTGSLWIPGAASSSAGVAPFKGDVQEFRYWKVALEDSILDNHALAPTSYQGNTDGVYTGSTSSFYDLSFRLCLGSDNNKFQYHVTNSFTSQHPNQSSILFADSSSKVATFKPATTSSWSNITETHVLEWPDLSGNRSISNKIRIDETTTTSPRLDLHTSVQKAVSDNNPIDSARLGIYLSPTNEINQDIAEQFGGLSIDDFIGDPSYASLEYYPGLEGLKREYTKKYTGKSRQQDYIRLLKHYDAALFKLLKKFVPYRANTQVGLVIEPDILHRTKLPINVPVTEELHYSSSIDLPEVTFITDGFVQDGDGEPFRDGSGYVQPGVISHVDGDHYTLTSNQEELKNSSATISGSTLAGTLTSEELKNSSATISGSTLAGTLTSELLDSTLQASVASLTNVNLIGKTNEYNLSELSEAPTGETNLGVSSYGVDTRLHGSKYVFMTYATSGSGANHSLPYLVTASRYDYHEALGPTILDSKRSEIANNSTNAYDRDIYFNKAFTNVNAYKSGAAADYKTIYTSSAAIYENDWTSHYGLEIKSLNISAVPQTDPWTSTAYWSLSGSYGLQFQTPGTQTDYTASVRLPAFFYKKEDPSTYDYIYSIKITTDVDNYDPNYLELHYGNLDCGLTGSINTAALAITTTVETKAIGGYLGFRWYITNTGNAAMFMKIINLEVRCLNYRAQTQDFHLRDSYGMRNARYDGCKLTAAGINVDSPDTIDGGPVIQVTVGNGKQLVTKPTQKSNFTAQ